MIAVPAVVRSHADPAHNRHPAIPGTFGNLLRAGEQQVSETPVLPFALLRLATY